MWQGSYKLLEIFFPDHDFYQRQDEQRNFDPKTIQFNWKLIILEHFSINSVGTCYIQKMTVQGYFEWEIKYKNFFDLEFSL